MAPPASGTQVWNGVEMPGAPRSKSFLRSFFTKKRPLACFLTGAFPGIGDRWRVLCYDYRIDGREIIARLKENESALRARGVMHAALFGSRARGDARPDSDIDIMVELDPAARVTVFNYVGLKEYISGLFEGKVDVVNRDGLKPYVRPAATGDAIYAF